MEKKNSRFTKVLFKIDDVLNFAEDKITIVFFTVSVLATIYGIVMRYFLRLPNMYGEEIARYSNIFCIFIGLGIVERKNAHMKVDLFINAIPKKASHILLGITRVLTVACYGYLAYLAWGYMVKMKAYHQLSTCMRVPMWIMYIFMFAGFAEGAFHAFVDFWSNYVAAEKHDTGADAEVTIN